MPNCAYCGKEGATDREHVIPKCLYPPSRSTSRVQRLTVPACRHCNNSWSSDEAHFRNVLMIAGEPNEAVREIWEGRVRRSFAQIDGRTRLTELVQQMVPVKVNGIGIGIITVFSMSVSTIVRTTSYLLPVT